MLGTYGFSHLHPRPPVEFEQIDLGNLPEYRSRNGMLSATLVAAPLTVKIGDAKFQGLAYNGAYGGPVLHVRAGDELRLHLINKTADVINLHFHGLRVSPEGRADNMHVEVPPGRAFAYDVRIPPGHPPGIFWYHDHGPGVAEAHVTGGLAGTIVIDGFAAQFPGLSSLKQKLLVLKDWSQLNCTDPILKRELHCRMVSINGAAHWADTMAPGSQALWRLSNEGSNLILHIAAPGLHFRIVGRDGLPALDGTQVDQIDIMPASRLDVLVQAPASGPVDVFARGVQTGQGESFSTSRRLGTIEVAGPVSAKPSVIPEPPHQADLRAGRIDTHRTVVLDENAEAAQYTINGRMYDRARTDFRVKLGSVEEWTLENHTQDFHVFHMHQLGFQVSEINGSKQEFSGYVDGVRVPEMGEVKILIPFTDPLILGHVMFHCHVLKHEDNGMMAQLEVYRPGGLHICRTPE